MFYCVNILFIFTIYIPDILMENSRSRWVSVKFRWLFYMFFVSLMFQSYGKHSMGKKYSGCFDPTEYLSYIDWIFTGKESKLNIQILSDLFVVETAIDDIGRWFWNVPFNGSWHWEMLKLCNDKSSLHQFSLGFLTHNSWSNATKPNNALQHVDVQLTHRIGT